MKRIWIVLVTLMLLLGLTACGQKAEVPAEESVPTWQEQYDLGIRYLSEGKYEEAILAFTAAIEIDAKQPLAFIGRAGAYIGSGETAESLSAALADYETAVGLDETNADAWLGLADVYIRQGEFDKAREVLEQALEKVSAPQKVQRKLQTINIDSPVTLQDNSIGALSFNGSGNELTIRFTHPEFPREVYVNNKNGCQFHISFSDGQETFSVRSYHFDKTNYDGMIVFPNESSCNHILYVVESGIEDPRDTWLQPLNTDVFFQQKGDTFIWQVELPNGAFDPADIQYIGYMLKYSESSETPITKTATFEVKNGQAVYFNNGKVSDLRFMASAADHSYSEYSA